MSAARTWPITEDAPNTRIRTRSKASGGHLRVSAFQRALQRIVDAVAPSHCALGIMVNSSAAAREWQERGVRYITTTFESLVAPASRSYLRGARER